MENILFKNLFKYFIIKIEVILGCIKINLVWDCLYLLILLYFVKFFYKVYYEVLI